MFCFQQSFSRRRQAPLPPVENASDVPHRDVPQANIRKSYRNISYPGRNNPFCGASHYNVSRSFAGRESRTSREELSTSRQTSASDTSLPK